MPNVSGLTTDQVAIIERETEARCKFVRSHEACCCGVRSTRLDDHSPDCAWVRSLDGLYERTWDEVASQLTALEDLEQEADNAVAYYETTWCDRQEAWSAVNALDRFLDEGPSLGTERDAKAQRLVGVLMHKLTKIDGRK